MACALQLKGLSSLEVARQRQSNRAKLHFHGAPQPAHAAPEVVQKLNIMPNALQQLPREVPQQLPLQETMCGKEYQVQPLPSAQQQARQKLNAIRDELGKLSG